MQYEIYIDRLLFLSFLFQFLLLFLTGKIAGQKVSVKRIAAGAFFSAAGFCILVILPIKELLGMLIHAERNRVAQKAENLKVLENYLAVIKLLTIFLISLKGIAWTFKKRGSKEISKILLIYGVCACFLAGGLGIFFSRGLTSAKKLVLVSSLLTILVLWMIHKKAEKKKDFCASVSIAGEHGQITLKALIDSGNSLRDPISGAPVCIAEKEALSGVISFTDPENFRVIPYHSIGKSHGLLRAVFAEQIKVQKDEKEMCFSRVLFALYEGKISQSGDYQVILHPDLFLEEETGSRKGKEAQNKEEEKYDLKSCDAGKNAV